MIIGQIYFVISVPMEPCIKKMTSLTNVQHRILHILRLSTGCYLQVSITEISLPLAEAALADALDALPEKASDDAAAAMVTI